MSSPPRILLVNDDGIDAPGIVLLERLMRGFSDDIWVVAPDEERSGAGHSISITHPIRVRQRDARHFAVKGSPTDCALLGIHEFLGDHRPDILISGINGGPNLAEDLTYSGTLCAVMEGAMLGIPSIALSQVLSYGAHVHWEASEKYLPGVIEKLLSIKWSEGNFINVNVPNVPPNEISGVRLTTQGLRPAGTFKPARRIDERKVPYYWIKIAHTAGELIEGTDLEAIHDQAVSVTPLRIDMTDLEMHRKLERLFA